MAGQEDKAALPVFCGRGRQQGGKETGDGNAVKGTDKKGLHERTSCWRRRKERLYRKDPFPHWQKAVDHPLKNKIEGILVAPSEDWTEIWCIWCGEAV